MTRDHRALPTPSSASRLVVCMIAAAGVPACTALRPAEPGAGGGQVAKEPGGTPTTAPTGFSAGIALPSLTDVEWRCVEVIGPDGVTVSTTEAMPTLRIAAGGRASGFAGVNRFGSDAAIGSARRASSVPLRFGPVVATRMAGPPERMAIERAFTEMLAEVREAVLAIDAKGVAELRLLGERGMLARFVRENDEAGR